jgi:hypothetical protein
MLLIDYYFIFAIVLLIDSYSDLQVSLLHHRTSMSDELETGNGGKRQREDLDEESDQPPSKSIKSSTSESESRSAEAEEDKSSQDKSSPTADQESDPSPTQELVQSEEPGVAMIVDSNSTGEEEREREAERKSLPAEEVVETETEEQNTNTNTNTTIILDRTGVEETADPADPTEAPESNAVTPALAETPLADTSTPSAATVPAALPSGLPPAVSAAVAAAPAPVDPAFQPTVTNPDQIIEERGEVSAVYIGRVIGKGGEMIRDLQARSGASINVEQKAPPGQPRVITYRGTRKTVDFAKLLVTMLSQEGVSEDDLPLGQAKREYLIIPAQSVGKVKRGPWPRYRWTTLVLVVFLKIRNK